MVTLQNVGVRETLGRARTIREEFLALEKSVPGFAGMYIDRNGETIVSAIDTVSVRAIERIETLRAFATAHRGRSDLSRVVKAKFSYSQLDSLMMSLPPRLAAASASLVGLSVDPELGLVNVEVDSEAAIGAVQKRLDVSALQMVKFTVRRRDIALQSLWSIQRPVRNGFAIANEGSSGWCSIGFNAFGDVQTERYFLTASHCALPIGESVGTVFIQPHLNVLAPTNNRVGVETFDTRPYSGSSAPPGSGFACPLGVTCIDGDVMAVRYDDGVPIEWSRTTSATTVPASRWYQIAPVWQSSSTIRSQDSWPLQGWTVDKVGATTGFSRGRITNTCRLIAPYDIMPFWQSCQIEVTGAANRGDSGAGVLSTAKDAFGILHGGVPGRSYIFTPLVQVRNALGISLYLR